MSTEQAYLQAVRDFVQALGADASGFDEGAEVSFEHDGLFAFIFLHPLEDRAVSACCSCTSSTASPGLPTVRPPS